MEMFVTVAVILAVIVLGVFLLHQLNSHHTDRIGTFHYGRSGLPVRGPDPAPHKTRGHGRMRPRRRIRKVTK